MVQKDKISYNGSEIKGTGKYFLIRSKAGLDRTNALSIKFLKSVLTTKKKHRSNHIQIK